MGFCGQIMSSLTITKKVIHFNFLQKEFAQKGTNIIVLQFRNIRILSVHTIISNFNKINALVRRLGKKMHF